MAGFVEVTGNAYPQPRVIYVQPVGEPRYNFFSRSKKETAPIHSLVHHDSTGEDTFSIPEDQAQTTGSKTEMAAIGLPSCSGNWMVKESTSKTADHSSKSDENDEEVLNEAGLPSLEKIAWVWPELKRRNAICVEIEKSVVNDEEVNLNQLRERLKVKMMKGKFLSRTPRKVDPKEWKERIGNHSFVWE